MAEEDVHAELPAEAPRRVVRTDLRADPAHPLHDGAEVHARSRRHLHPERRRVTDLPDDVRRAEHRLRGYAACDEAVAAHEVPLDQRDPGAQARGAGGGDEPRRSRADHHEVVASRRLRVVPAGGVSVLDEGAVVGVVGEQPWRRGHVVAPPHELPEPAVQPKQ
jgi:hypothetical protein